MPAMLIFLALCMILGLWIKPKVRSGLAIIAVMAFLLVLIFYVFPSRL